MCRGLKENFVCGRSSFDYGEHVGLGDAQNLDHDNLVNLEGAPVRGCMFHGCALHSGGPALSFLPYLLTGSPATRSRAPRSETRAASDAGHRPQSQPPTQRKKPPDRVVFPLMHYIRCQEFIHLAFPAFKLWKYPRFDKQAFFVISLEIKPLCKGLDNILAVLY